MRPDRVAAGGSRLALRGEDVVMGRCVGHLGEPAIRACLAVVDDAALVRIAFVLEHKERIDEITAMLSEDRLRHVFRAVSEQQLWPEALDLLDHLSPAPRAPLGDPLPEPRHPAA